jgi:biopolymer transport protein ExbB
LVTAALFLSLPVKAEEEEIEAKSIGELLQLVRDGKTVNKRTNEKRERDFLADKSKQQKAVRDAEAAQKREEARSERLEARFEKND